MFWIGIYMYPLEKNRDLYFEWHNSLSLTLFAFVSCVGNWQPKDGMAKSLHDRYASLMVKRFPRRLLLQFMGFNPILLCVYPIIAAPLPEMKEPEVIQ